MFGLGILFILIGIVGFIVDGQFEFSLPIIGVGAILLLYDYYKYTKENKTPTVNREKLYQNHCWFCHNEINSNFNRKCPKCKKYYICNHCGRCLCDNHEYNIHRY